MFIYEIHNGTKHKLIEKRNNPFANSMQHQKTLDVYELIKDCSIIISASIGKKGIQRLQKRRLKLFFKKGNIQKALSELAKEVWNDKSSKEKQSRVRGNSYRK